MAEDNKKAQILSFEEARAVIDGQSGLLRPSETETLALLDAADHVLADAIAADRDLPPFPRATRDGYAVRASDLEALPVRLQVIGEIRAGTTFAQPKLESGQAIAIMTGAPVPPSTDAVVMVEYTAKKDQYVEITKGVAAGENVVPRGAEAHQGATLVDKGARLNDAAIALAASAGHSQISVYRRPRVAILATGDEIVGIDATPSTAQIRNSNSYSLAVQVRAAGGEPELLPIAPDEPRRLKELIEEGLRSDLLLIAGGVSMGRYDLVEQVLDEFGTEFFFTGAKIQPGKPVVFGKARGKYFFGLPGNPISTMVTFELFARPILDALAGMSPRKLQFLYARAKTQIRIKPGLTRFLPAILSGEFENTYVQLVPWQGSGDIAAVARANCYAVIAPDRERIAADEWLPVMMR